MSTLRHPPKYLLAPADDQDIAWIARLQREVYSPEDAIPERVIRGWYEANPRGFWVVKSHDGRRCGHVDLLPLTPAGRDQVLAGGHFERDIHPSLLRGPHDHRLTSAVYVESVAAAPAADGSNVGILTAMLEGFSRALDAVSHPDRLEALYAIAASDSGSQLMRHMGMEILADKAHRVDAHDLYRGEAVVVRARAAALYEQRAAGTRPTS